MYLTFFDQIHCHKDHPNYFINSGDTTLDIRQDP